MKAQGNIKQETAKMRSPRMDEFNIRRPMDKVVYLCSRTVRANVFLACALWCLFGCGAKNRAAEDDTSDGATKTPATVEQAARILDLSTFPLMDGAKLPESRQVGNVFYLAPGDVKSAFEFNRKTLVVQGWKELPDSSVTDQSASAMFSRSGFIVYLTVTPTGDGMQQARLQNQGNVKPGKLPVPPNAKPVYVGDSTAMYETEAAVAATADACRNLFTAQGWVPYATPAIPPSSNRTQSSSPRLSRPRPRGAGRP
jgi:hypothetical protein